MIVLHQMLTCTLDLAGLFHNFCNLASIILLKTISVKIMNNAMCENNNYLKMMTSVLL